MYASLETSFLKSIKHATRLALRTVATFVQTRQNKELIPTFATIILVMSLFATQKVFAMKACSLFRVHNSVSLPAAPQIEMPKTFSKDWEQLLIEKIGRVPTQNHFPKIYQSWLKSHAFDLTESERYQWLHCVDHFIHLDTNKNGIPDWTAIVQEQPSQVLYPNDPDQDGDGIPNVLDADPLHDESAMKQTALLTEKKMQTQFEIPAHLKILRPDVGVLQNELFKKFKIIAIDHTDQHSAFVLNELLFLLQNGFPPNFQLKNLRIIYAFAGHDPSRNIASYHLQAEAMSVGGFFSYGLKPFSAQKKIDLLVTLAHEIGHAVLFEKLTPKKLMNAAVKFAQWPSSDNTESFFAPIFFQAHLLSHGKNLVSQYSVTNQHEWFAESMSASILTKLGRKGLLGNDWHSLLMKAPQKNSPFLWTDYNQISDDLNAWLESLLQVE